MKTGPINIMHLPCLLSTANENMQNRRTAWTIVSSCNFVKASTSLAFTYSALERVMPFDRSLKVTKMTKKKKKSIHYSSAWSGAMTGSGLRGWFGLSTILFFTSPNHLDDWWRWRCFWCISCFSGEVVYLFISFKTAVSFRLNSQAVCSFLLFTSIWHAALCYALWSWSYYSTIGQRSVVG